MSLNVLIVDDSDVIRTMIARTLGLSQVPLGAIQQASNGREALAILEQEWVDLVLADINMPVMDGAEMIERMRQQPETADIPVIVLSSEGATERVAELMRHGVTAWVRKPFTPEELRDAIRALPSDETTSAQWADEVDAVFTRVLETFAFTYAEPSERGEPMQAGTDLLNARITFTGATRGVLSVSAPCELCVELAANILGTDQDDPDARMRGVDALGEIANIVAGQLATLVEPNSSTGLQPPVVSQIDSSEWGRYAADTSARTYLVEGLPFVVTLGMRSFRASN